MSDNHEKNPKKRKMNSPASPKIASENHEPFSFYSLLDIPKTSTSEEIKKAYRSLALKFHPDKNPESAEEARKKFQKITEAYQILMDPEKRKLYDETGTFLPSLLDSNPYKIEGTVDSGNLDEFMDAYKYFRTLYRKIEKEDIDEFSKKYRHSELENEDLIKFYNDHKGDVTLILESIPLSKNEDIDRFLKFYDDMIKEKKLEEFKKFNSSRKKIKKLKEEDDWEDEEEKKEDFNDLVKAIALKNKTNFEDYFKNLEEKYANGKNKKKGKGEKKEIQDAEFEEIQKKLDKNKRENLKKIKK